MERKGAWKRFKECQYEHPGLGFSLDYSRMKFPDHLFVKMDGAMQKAFQAMEALEKGAIANPDEKRMVGHYWLRKAGMAPTAGLREETENTIKRVKAFAQEVHQGVIVPPDAPAFRSFLLIGIGGSALGPQLVCRALGTSRDRLRPLFLDNTDPDGFDLTFECLGAGLKETLFLVISKSGGTPETRNGMVEAKAACVRSGLAFEPRAVAITCEGSALAQLANQEGARWLATFPMWDWVGGRTSETSAVGLLPAALQGLDIDGLLAGAGEMDEATRSAEVRKNPAALLALMWYHAGRGRGLKDMVILPYKDRLDLFSKYLQQLIMESLGKELDLEGRTVRQGIAVYGNKGSTDQHAYIQQLREGLPNFFATFIEVLRDRQGPSPEVEPMVHAGDFLSGFLHGTRQALYEKGRLSLTLTIERLDARSLGALIALYERAVGLYANLVGINPYHQPGVEAGKKAAASLLAIQKKILQSLQDNPGRPLTSEAWAAQAGLTAQTEAVHLILRHLAAQPERGLAVEKGANQFQDRYAWPVPTSGPSVP